MHTSKLLLAIAGPTAVLAHAVGARQPQASLPAPAPAPTAPAAAPTAPAPAPTMDHNTMDHGDDEEEPQPTAAPTPTRPVGGYSDLAKCELAIDTLLRAFDGVPTPNPALSSFLATETRAVADPCQWASDVPQGLSEAYSAYSSEFVSVLSVYTDLVTQLESCVDAGGASVTRAEIVTPLFALPDCEAVSTADKSGTTSGPRAETTTTRGFPAGATTTSTAGVAPTGVALVGVAAAALLGVAGAL